MPRKRSTELRLTPDALVATLHCQRIDFFTIHQISRIIYSPLAAMFQMPIVLDLSNVEVMPRIVLQTLFKSLRELQEQGQRFILTGLERHAHLAGDITQFRLRFEIYPAVDDALENLGRYSYRRRDQPTVFNTQPPAQA